MLPAGSGLTWACSSRRASLNLAVDASPVVEPSTDSGKVRGSAGSVFRDSNRAKTAFRHNA